MRDRLDRRGWAKVVRESGDVELNWYNFKYPLRLPRAKKIDTIHRMLMHTRKTRLEDEGLNSLTYKLVSKKEEDLFTHCMFDLGYNWTNPDPEDWQGEKTESFRKKWVTDLSEFEVKRPDKDAVRVNSWTAVDRFGKK